MARTSSISCNLSVQTGASLRMESYSSEISGTVICLAMDVRILVVEKARMSRWYQRRSPCTYMQSSAWSSPSGQYFQCSHCASLSLILSVFHSELLQKKPCRVCARIVAFTLATRREPLAGCYCSDCSMFTVFSCKPLQPSR